MAVALRIIGSNPYVLENMHYGSEYLSQLHADFVDLYGGSLSVTNFYEERRTRLIKFGLLQWETYV